MAGGTTRSGSTDGAEADGRPAAATRRRGAELEQAIFDAVWTELAENGYAKLTMEGVAARAQTGKQVLYRRWANRPQLVLAAVRARSGSILRRVPDTGSLRADIVAVFTHMAARQQELGTETVRGLMFDVGAFDPGMLAQITDVYAAVLGRAVERGELACARPTGIEAAANLLRYRLLISAEPVADAEVERLVDEVCLPLLRAHDAGSGAGAGT